MSERRIVKVLSLNDTGETGGHQSGILVPIQPEILAFFPILNPNEYNPRCHINFLDDDGVFWELAFIYYNNKYFNGTRNEYRLTRMTKYIRQSGLVVGDEIVLSNDGSRYRISFNRRSMNSKSKSGALKLGSGWRVIKI
jgi:hypothetical protein